MWSQASYSDYEFMRLKQDAIRRAQEMQKRAKDPTVTTRSSGGWQGNSGAKSTAETRCPRCGRRIVNGKHVFEDSETPNFQNNMSGARQRSAGRAAPPNMGGSPPPNTGGQRYKRAAAPKNPLGDILSGLTGLGKQPPPEEGEAEPRQSKINIPFLGDIAIDKDFLIVGGLLLVLLSEGCDQQLLLALMYIML